MKKSSLLALSMVSLVALVGCNNSAPSKPNAKAMLTDLFSLSFGKESLKYAEIEEITADGELAELGWYIEGSTSQYFGGLIFTLESGTTIADCYNEILVGTAEEPAEISAFTTKYDDQLLFEPDYELKEANGYFTGALYVGKVKTDKEGAFVSAQYVLILIQANFIPANAEGEDDQLLFMAASYYLEEKAE